MALNIKQKTAQSGTKPRYRPPCASIVIASRGPGEADTVQTKYGEIRSRSGADLKYTANDAERVHNIWKREDDCLPEDLHVLLIDPSLKQAEKTVKDISAKILADYDIDVGLDLFFAGHGEQHTGNLVLKDGRFSPTQFLTIQAEDVEVNSDYQRTIGAWLDSCYSGAFLIRLAIEAFENFEGFRLDEGLASCLPDEKCFEMELLEHGIFTYTRLNPGNAHVDRERFNKAILENNEDEIAKGLQGLVAMMSSATAFLTKGKQFSVSLTKHVIDVDGGFATVELGDTSCFAKVSKELTNFKGTQEKANPATATP